MALVLSPLTGGLLIGATALTRRRAAQGIAIACSLIGLAAGIEGLRLCADGSVMSYTYGGWPAPYGIEARVDGFGAALATMIAAVSLGVFFYAGPSLRAELPRDEPAFFATALLLVAALQGMTVTADLFNLYVFLEISSLTAYALVAIGGGAASLASFRYLVIGTLGASFYLLGVAYLFALTGTLNAADAAVALGGVASSPALVLAISLIALGLGLKMALFPLHDWLPDSYTFAPSTASALIGGLMTKVSALALIRVLYLVFAPSHRDLVDPIREIVAYLGGAGIVFGSVMAVAQRDLKRMFAYSSVAHLGFIAVGIGMANKAGISGAVFHMIAHGVAKATLFLIAGGIAYRVGSRNVDALAGVHRKMPLSAAALVVAAFSMIGIPPTAGFYSKWYLLMGCLEAGHPGLFTIVVCGTLLSAWYFLRLFEVVFFGKAESRGTREELPLSMLAPIAVGALLLIVLGVNSQAALEGLFGATPLVGAMLEAAAR
jgi:multicomponent Na+:H+ antiporter subunit D